MKQWISDKKNLPIVIALVVVLLIGAGVVGAFSLGLLGQSAPGATPVAYVPPTSNTPPGATPGASGIPGRPIGATNPAAPPAPFTPPSQIGAASAPSAAPHAPGAPPTLPTTPGGPPAPVGATPPAASPAAQIAASNLSPAQKAALMNSLSKITPQQQAQLTKLENMTPAQRQALQKKMMAALAAGGFKMPNIPGMPGVGGTQVAIARSRNPFAPGVNVAQLLKAATPPPVSSYLSFIRLARLPNIGGTTNYPVNPATPNGPATITVPLGRVAGIINSNGIRAIYEIDGKDTLVTPGSLLPENGGRVLSIQSDSITVQPTDSNQTVQVPITAGNPATTGNNNPGAPTPFSPPTPDQTNNNDLNND